jgi:hypothetical protein
MESLNETRSMWGQFIAGLIFVLVIAIAILLASNEASFPIIVGMAAFESQNLAARQYLNSQNPTLLPLLGSSAPLMVGNAPLTAVIAMNFNNDYGALLRTASPDADDLPQPKTE